MNQHRGKLGLWAAVAILAFATLAGRRAMAYDYEKAIPDEYRINGFALGCQAYSFNRFSFFEAVERTKETGCRLIEAYPGQRLSPDDDTPFSHEAPKAVWDKAKAKLDEEGIKIVAYGVVTPNPANEDNYRKIFEFAKYMGICVINSEPPLEACDMLGKLAKEYDIPVGIHNHPRRPDDPSYVHWSPEFVLKCADGNEEWVGSNADSGHWMRSEIVPMDALKKLEGHVVSMHLKDLNKMGRPGEHDVPYGMGKADIAAILTYLDKIGYKGPISLEYEYDWEGSVPEIAQCVGFVRGYGAALEE